MRKLLILLVFAFSLLGAYAAGDDYSVPKKVTIAGKVNHLQPGKNELTISANRPGFNSISVHAKADSTGAFTASFEIFTPTDVWVLYKTNFLVLVQPGDSIYVEFDGQANDRPPLLESIRFGGHGAAINRQASKFQRMFFSNPIYTDWDKKERVKKEYDVDRYVLYLDTLKWQIDALYNRFVDENKPDELVRVWAKTYIEQTYYDALGWYPDDHIRANNLKEKEWSVPSEYYEALLKRLPLERNMLVSGDAMHGFVNRFHYHYSLRKMWEEEANKHYVLPNGAKVAPTNVMDSLYIYGIIKHTPDKLLRQMVLTERFQQELDRSNIRLYEKYKQVADEYIVEPFLKEPLYAMYLEVKNRIEKSVMATDAYLKKLENTSAKQLVDTIRSNNKGKVIYVDCWATWCGPCKAEMPNSKKLAEELKDKDVAFVYLCIESEEKLWKANLTEFQLGGQHYLLSGAQSADLRSVFGIQGIPFYFLIDQNGTIVESGSHLRPNNVKDKIVGLLKK